MRRSMLPALLAFLVLPLHAAQHSTKISVQDLQQVMAVSEAAHTADSDLAQQLSGMQLTERLSTVELARLKTLLPGEKAQLALVALADQSSFLDPPAAEILANRTPDPAALRQMLVSVVNYVNTTIRQLPNFIATRATTRFEDRPQENLQGSVGMTSLTYLPLHVVGRSDVSVTYRDGHEVVEKGVAKARKSESQEQGLFTEGVFGPILSTVVGDALKGKITWSRWEQGADSPQAVFHYEVLRGMSHYSVGYCCVSNGISDNMPETEQWHSFAEIAAYHGEIAFDPASGAILRITLVADMPPNEVVSWDGTMVEYGAVDIGGKSYICPLRSVSALLAHSTQPSLGMTRAETYNRPEKTFVNDAVFEQYRRFGSETRILAGNGGDPTGNRPPAVIESATSTSPDPAAAAIMNSQDGSDKSAVPATAAETALAPAAVSVVTPAAEADPEISVETHSGETGSDQSNQHAAAAPSPPPGYTLKVTTRLVDVSLVADDKKRHTVSGLRAEDVEVFDNGRRQEIKSFARVDAVLPALDHTPGASPETIFSNHAVDPAADSPASPHPAPGATVLLIDESHIAWNDLNNARTQMLQFLSAMHPDEPIGLYSMSSLGFRVLADVTTDHAAVSERLRKWMPTVQSLAQAQDEETRNRQQFNEVRNVSDLGSVNGNQVDLPDALGSVDPQLLTMGDNPARASLIILVGVARRLAAVAGHKNLVWISSDNVFADWRDHEAGIHRQSGFLDSFALRAQEAMNDAHVAVYPFDVSQLETGAIGADIQHRNVELTPSAKERANLPNDSSAGRVKAGMLQDIRPIQWPVRQVAEATGGRAIRRSGDLAAALSGIVEDGHATYVLSFSPDQPADGQYHAITLKLSGKQHGLTLRYRTGYLYTKDPATLKDRFEWAVWQPADANQLTLTAKVIRDKKGASLQVNIAAAGLNMEQESERWTDKLDVFFIERDDAGLRAQVEGQTLGLNLKPSTYQQLLSTGIPYEHIVQSKQGMSSLRILVVDKNSGRMGSVTIPVSALGDPAH